MLRSIFIFHISYFIFIQHLWASPNDFVFTENKNQWHKNVLFKADIPSGNLFLERNCFTYQFYDAEALNRIYGHKLPHPDPPQKGGEIVSNSTISSPSVRSGGVRFHSFKVNFLNSNSSVMVRGTDKSEHYNNYFIGNEKSKWASEVYSYNKVAYQNLYDKINMEIYTSENNLKYDFIVKPNGNTNDILLDIAGVSNIYLKDGNLIIKTSLNELIEQKPFAYQEINGIKKIVACNFILKNTPLTPLKEGKSEITHSTLKFEFPNDYDHSKELIIDPVLIFASYSGSTADNFGMTATYDNRGNLYAGGTAFNIGYHTTVGAYDTTFGGTTGYGITDVVISKYDSTGSNMIYSTYLGGSGAETVHSLIVNEKNELYLYGVTSSDNFPTQNAYDNSFNGGSLLFFLQNGTRFTNGTDIYVAKFNATGTDLLASTFVGGSGNDGVNYKSNGPLLTWNIPDAFGNIETITANYYTHDSLMFNYGDQYRGEIMLDKDGNCYIASCTRSSDFPTPNGFQKKIGGQQDAVICKFSSDLKNLLWSSYLGGSDKDAAYSIKVDDAQNVFVTGGTTIKSGTIISDFPTTSTAINKNYMGGLADGFVTKISSDGKTILSSTFIGTNLYDQSYLLELDKTNNVYIIGQTLGNYPVQNAKYFNANGSQFITKLDNQLSKIIFSTRFGNGNGQINISPSAFLVDYCENIYVSGWGASILQNNKLKNMPITKDAFQKTTDGFDFYLMALSRDADSLVYGTYFGDPNSPDHVDGGTSRFDKKGIVYQSVCAGCGGSSTFPTTKGSWSQTNNSSNCNNGTFKFDFRIMPKAKFKGAQDLSNHKNCGPLTVNFVNESVKYTSYQWNFGNGDTTSKELNPTRTFTKPGTYKVTLIILNTNCNLADTAVQEITIYQPVSSQPIVSAKDTSICKGEQVILSINTNGVAKKFIWSSDSTFSDTLNTLKDSTVILIPQKSTTYYARAFNDFCADTVSTKVSVYPSINLKTNPNISICKGDTALLFATTNGKTENYVWSTNKKFSDTLNLNNDSTIKIIPTASKIYFVKSYIQLCEDSSSTSVTVISDTSYTLFPKMICDRDSTEIGSNLWFEQLYYFKTNLLPYSFHYLHAHRF